MLAKSQATVLIAVPDRVAEIITHVTANVTADAATAAYISEQL